MMIGASSYIWVSPFTTEDLEQLQHAKELGFDIYEIAVERPELIDDEKVAAEAQRTGIRVHVCGAYGETRDISSDVPEYRENGMAYGKRLIEMAAQWARHTWRARCMRPWEGLGLPTGKKDSARWIMLSKT